MTSWVKFKNKLPTNATSKMMAVIIQPRGLRGRAGGGGAMTGGGGNGGVASGENGGVSISRAT